MKQLHPIRMYLVVLIYLLLLRGVLFFTVDMPLRPLGLLYDLVVMMFWVGFLSFFLKTATAQKIWYLFVVYMSSLFVIVDSVYHDYFGVLFARSSISGLRWLQEGNTLEYDINIPLVAYLITPILIGVTVLIVRTKQPDKIVFRLFLPIMVVFVAQVGLFLYWGNQSFSTRIEYYRSDAFLFETMHDRTRYSAKYGYYNYHLLDLTRLRRTQDVSAQIDRVDEFFANLPSHTPNAYSDRYAGYNVVMIVGETLETRFIDPVLTPNLYLMQNQGMRFDNYFSTVFQQGATCNSEYMGLTGLVAITTNDWSSNICDAYSENNMPYALPAQLKEIGYDTYYFHSGYEWFYNRKTMVPNYGFETVKFQEDLIERGHTEFNDRFDTNMGLFLEEYLTYDNPFFLTLLTYSMHGAYNQLEFEVHADQLEAAYPNQELDPEIRNYMLKLIEFDTMLGDLMDRLEDEGELDETLFVVFPDHYPYMMDEDVYLGHIGIDGDIHEVMRQNLILYATDMTGEVIHTTGSQIDIAPTVLNMIHQDGVFDYFMGTDLLGTTENYVIFSDLTITDGTNILYLDEAYEGDPSRYSRLEEALADRITMLEIQKDLLNSDYFRRRTE